MVAQVSNLVDATGVAAYLGLSPSATELDELAEVAEAVTALVVAYRGLPDDGDDWPANVSLGAKMLAARLYRRRNSPAGVEALGELGPVYVSRNDPDLSQLLELGRYAPPKVG